MSQLEPETVAPDPPNQAAPFGPWSSHRPRLIPLLRWCLLTVVLIGMSAWLFLTPRQASVGDFAQNLQAGTVRGYEVGSRDQFDRFRGLIFNDGGTDRQELAWCTGTLRCQRVHIDDLGTFLDDGTDAADEEDREFNGDYEVVDRFVDRYAAEKRPMAGQTYPWLGPLGATWALSWLIMLWVLITGPQPRHVTKWAGFWILCLPGGLGVLYMLTREAPWSRAVATLPEPPPSPWPGRWTGGKTFLLALLIGGLATALPTLVGDLLP